MKRLALFLLLCAQACAAPNPVEDLYHQAQDAVKASRWDDAIGYYEKVIEEHPEDPGRWFDAQRNIAEILTKKGDLPAAAQAAHVCLDAAPNLQAFDGVVGFTAGILSAQDKTVDRANQFLAFQQTGQNTNPMDAVGYPAMPAREAAFAALRQQLGEDASASRVRALTFLFTGHPRDALAQFSEAFRKNTNPYDLTNAGIELVTVGLRTARGHRVGLDKAMQFVVHGPGKADAADPFAEFGPPPPPGQGGLANIGPASLAALRKVHDAARLYAGDPLAPVEMRRAGINALDRANLALDDWGEPGQVQWYIHLALGIGCPAPDEYTTGYLSGIYYAGRGRASNYGGVTAAWNEFDAERAAHNIQLPRQQQASLDGIRGQFTKNMGVLAGVQFPPVNFQPLKTPAKF